MKLVKTLSNVFLAVTLLVATTGITLSKHYCMGRLKSIAVFEHAKSCMGSDFEDPMPCCEDVDTQLKVEELTKTSIEIDLHPTLFQVACWAWELPNLPDHAQVASIPFLNYYPPPPQRDSQTDYQVYII